MEQLKEQEEDLNAEQALVDSEYLSMRRLYNDKDVYVEENIPNSDYVNLTYKGPSIDQSPRMSLRQSPQSDISLEDMIRSRRMTETTSSRASGNQSPYLSQRKSAQMDTFVENFIRPKLNTENISLATPSAKLTKELMQRVSKKRTNFNLIIVGEKGLGKRTFIQALVKNSVITDEEENSKPTINKSIVQKPFVLLKDGQKVYLNVIEVPEFGAGLNSGSVLMEILEYVDESFEESFKRECSLDRRVVEDKKIHCCLYFISPFGHSLKPLDIVFLKEFQSKINIIPVIAKCDIFTKAELQRFKTNVLNDFAKHGIDLFEYLTNSEPIEDEIDDIKEICEEIKNNIPFAIASSVEMVNTGINKAGVGREYTWGNVLTENPSISDFCRLEKILTKSHVNYFKKLTKTVYYENFRMKYILERVK